MRVTRGFLVVEIALFAIAASTHFGLLMSHHRHHEASIAETMIGLVLLIGLVSTVIRPAATRVIAITVQAFALFGTIVGIFTIIAGIGPKSLLDAGFHAAMIVTLVAGLIVAYKLSPAPISLQAN